MSKKKPWWAFWRKEEQEDDLDKTMTRDMPAASLDEPTRPAFRVGELGGGRFAREQEGTRDQGGKSARRPSVALRPGVRAPVEPPSTPPPAPSPSPSQPPPETTPPPLAYDNESEAGPSLLFWSLFFLLLTCFSVPLWLTTLPPMEHLPSRLAVLGVIKNWGAVSSYDPYLEYRPLLYAGNATYYLLYGLQKFIPTLWALRLLLQFYLLALPLALLYLLQVWGRSRWNVFFGFFFLYNGVFVEGDLEFLLAAPFLLFGVATVYGWMKFNRPLFGFALLALSWILVPLDLGAYLMLMLLAFITAFFFSRSLGDWISNLILPFSSFLFLLPWFLFLLLSSKPIPAIVQGASWIQYPSFRQKWVDLLNGGGNLFRFDTDEIILAGIFVLVLWGVASRQTAAPPRHSWGIRAFPEFFVVLFLFVYFALPSHLWGMPLSAAPLVALIAWLLLGWIRLVPQGIGGYLLLACTVLWGIFQAAVLAYGFHYHEKEFTNLRWLLRQAAPRKRLLVWTDDQARVSRIHLHPLGGYYMLRSSGMSNLILRPLGWSVVHYRPTPRPPSPLSRQRPPLQGWDYLLTHRALPDSRSLHLLGKAGPLKLYKIRSRHRSRRRFRSRRRKPPRTRFYGPEFRPHP